MGEWNPRANDIFLKAVDLADADDREQLIAAECGDDSALRKEVDALLGAHELPSGVLENSPADAILNSLPKVPAPEGVDSVIGPYRLVEIIGEGGMGTVYRAEQTTPVRRFVALKVIKVGMDTRKVIARFEAERQALAMMDHPNIARVLDAGTTPTGRPFFVMELVDGVPLTDYCDNARLTPARRIDLFLPVCRAIQHAHQKGIIHRDIKPTNVLVGVYDGVPVPKVIDFGVAKATARRTTDETDLTQLGIVVGTLRYMSPEQAETDGQDVDTRSDVYSLGVLLYELLTGSTPVPKEKLRDAAMAEALRVVRDTDPPRPSTRLNQTDTLGSVAATRGIEPARLTGLVRGELDWIVMKALEKDRTRRYETPNGFAADLLRYQADEPVEAHPPSLRYRIRKNFRRHRAGLLTGASLVILLLGGTGISTWQAIRATREKRRGDVATFDALVSSERAVRAADAERLAKEDAQRRLGQLERADGILESIFTDLNVRETSIGRTSIQSQLAKLLIRASAQFEGEGFKDNATRFKMQMLIGGALNDLSYSREAIAPLYKSLAGFTSEGGRDSDDAMQAAESLATAMRNSGDCDGAIKLESEALASEIRRHGENSRYAIDDLTVLGSDYIDTGQVSKGIPLLEKAVESCRLGFPPQDRLSVKCVGNLAEAYEHVGDDSKSIPMIQQVLDNSRAATGPDSSTTLLYENNLATALHGAGRVDEAVALLERVCERDKVVFGPDHRETITSMNNLASAYQDAGKIDQAVEMLALVLQKTTDTEGPDHPKTFIATSNLAMAYNADNQAAKALPMMVSVAKRSQDRYGPKNLDALHDQFNLAGVYHTLGQNQKAVEILTRTIEIETTEFGADYPATIGANELLGLCYADGNRVEDALELFQTMLKQSEQKSGPDARQSVRNLHNLGYTQVVAKRPAEAAASFEEEARRWARTVGETDRRTINALSNLVAAQLDDGHTSAAESTADKVMLLQKQAPWSDPRQYVEAEVSVVTFFDRNKEYVPAERYMRDAVDVSSRQIPDSWITYYTQSEMGDLLARQRKFDQAEPFLRSGYDGLRSRLRSIPVAKRSDFVYASNWMASLYHITKRETLTDFIKKDSYDARKQAWEPQKSDAVGETTSRPD